MMISTTKWTKITDNPVTSFDPYFVINILFLFQNSLILAWEKNAKNVPREFTPRNSCIDVTPDITIFRPLQMYWFLIHFKHRFFQNPKVRYFRPILLPIKPLKSRAISPGIAGQSRTGHRDYTHKHKRKPLYYILTNKKRQKIEKKTFFRCLEIFCLAARRHRNRDRHEHTACWNFFKRQKQRKKGRRTMTEVGKFYIPIRVDNR